MQHEALLETVQALTPNGGLPTREACRKTWGLLAHNTHLFAGLRDGAARAAEDLSAVDTVFEVAGRLDKERVRFVVETCFARHLGTDERDHLDVGRLVVNTQVMLAAGCLAAAAKACTGQAGRNKAARAARSWSGAVERLCGIGAEVLDLEAPAVGAHTEQLIKGAFSARPDALTAQVAAWAQALIAVDIDPPCLNRLWVPVVAWTGTQSALKHLAMWRVSEGAGPLIEHPQTALLPLGERYVEAIKRAWESAGRPAAWWALKGFVVCRTNVDGPQTGGSLGGAAAVGMRLLASGGAAFDRDTLVLASIEDGADGLWKLGGNVELAPKKVAGLLASHPRSWRVLAHEEVHGNIRQEAAATGRGRLGDLVWYDDIDLAGEWASGVRLRQPLRSYLERLLKEPLPTLRRPCDFIEPHLVRRAVPGAVVADGDVQPTFDGTSYAEIRNSLGTVLELLASGAASYVALLAPPGYGKTACTAWLSVQIVEAGKARLDRVEGDWFAEPGPLFALPVSAKVLHRVYVLSKDNEPRVGDCLRQAARIIHAKRDQEATGEALDLLVDRAQDPQTGRAVVVIVDDWHELTSDERDAVKALVLELARWPCGLLITSSEEVFDLPAAGSSQFRIEPFSPVQARQYVESRSAGAQSEHCLAVSQTLSRGGVSGTVPLVLACVCEAAEEGVIPRSRAEAIEHTVSRLLTARCGNIERARMLLDFVRRLGRRWWEEAQGTSEFDTASVKKWIEAVRERCIPSGYTIQEARNLLRQQPEEMALELLSDLLECRILVPSIATGERLKWSHDWILHWAAAGKVAEEIRGQDELGIEFLADAARAPLMPLALAIALADATDPAGFMEKLAATISEPFHAALVLLARSLAELPSIDEIPSIDDGGAEGRHFDLSRVIEPLIALLESRASVDRERSADALGGLSAWCAPADRARVASLLASNRPEVRAAAVDAMCAMRAFDAAETLSAHFANDGGLLAARAVRRLAVWPPEIAIPLLDAALTNPSIEISTAGVAALADLGGTEPHKRLVALLESPSGWIRAAAVSALAGVYDARTEMLLWEVAKTAERPEGRAAAVAALGMGNAYALAERALALVNDESPLVRSVLADALGRARAQGLLALLPLLADEHPEVAGRAVTAIAEIGDPETKRHVEPLLRSQSEIVRVHALSALSRLGSGESTIELLALPTDSASGGAVVSAIGRAGGEAASERLISLVESSSPARVFAAAELARTSGDRVTSALCELLCDKEPAARVVAARALAQRADRPAVDRLVLNLADDNWRARVAAAEALGAVGAEEAVPALLAAADQRDERVRRASLNALITCARFEDLLDLVRPLDEFLPRQRYLAAEELYDVLARTAERQRLRSWGEAEQELWKLTAVVASGSAGHDSDIAADGSMK